MIKDVPCWCYQQFDADYSLEFPGEGFGGWKKFDVPFDLSKTAVVVMHHWEIMDYDQVPGHWKTVEYIPRANYIARNLLPPFLDKVRESNMRIIHVGSDGQTITHYPGYQKVREIAGEPTVIYNKIPSSETLHNFHVFKNDMCCPGKHNVPDILKGREKGWDFDPAVRPKGDELVATQSEQIYKVCLEYGIEHLVYTGFANNFCLMISPGGWVDMSRHGLICSIVKELTTAVENKESCRTESNKEYGFWNLAINSGVVFEKNDFEVAISNLVKGE